MWYTTQQRLLFAAVGAVAGGAAVLDTRRFVLHQTDGTADQWVSPPPPAQPLPAPPPFLSHSHRAHLVRSWNDGVDAAFSSLIRECSKRGW